MSDDLEVYIRDCGPREVLSAMAPALGSFRLECRFDEDYVLYAKGKVKLLFQRNLHPGYLMVWLRGANLWESDIDFARYLSQSLEKAVRCDPGADYPDVSPYSDTFVEISDGRETLVEWGQGEY